MEATIYITDKSGKAYWRTHCGYGYHDGELHNLQRHLAYVKAGRSKSIDAASARIVLLVDGVERGVNPSDAELLADLGL